MLSPACRAESLALRESFERNSSEISRFRVHSVAPPSLDSIVANIAILGVLENEEDEDHTDSVTRVQRSR
jgi:hypothetical protein